MDEVDIEGQDVLNSVLVNGVGVAATDLHEFEGLAAAQSGDFYRYAPGQVWIAVFVNIFHAHLPAPS